MTSYLITQLHLSEKETLFYPQEPSTSTITERNRMCVTQPFSRHSHSPTTFQPQVCQYVQSLRNEIEIRLRRCNYLFSQTANCTLSVVEGEENSQKKRFDRRDLFFKYFTTPRANLSRWSFLSSYIFSIQQVFSSTRICPMLFTWVAVVV